MPSTALRRFDQARQMTDAARAAGCRAGLFCCIAMLTACATTSEPAGPIEAPTPAVEPPAAEPPAAEPPAVSGPADLSNGARVYQSLCAFCHGDNGRGGTGGGTSLHTEATVDEVMSIVIGGRNMMPGLSASLSEVEIRDVSAYVTNRFGTAGE